MTTASAPKKKPKLAKRLVLVVVALGISVCLAEVLYRGLKPAPFVAPEIWSSTGERIPTSEIANFLRTSDEGGESRPHPRGSLKPGLSFRQFYDRPTLPYFDSDGCISALINELGFRDLPFDLEKKPGEFRILTVGDSFTFGSGVQTEDTWSQVLEALLRTERDEHVEVINGGFAAGSHHAAGYVDWIASHGVDFEPDVLVLGLCLNDVGDVPMLGYPVLKPKQPWLGGISEMLNTVQQSMAMRDVKNTKQDRALITAFFQQGKLWNGAMTALTTIHEVTEKRNVRLLVAIFPMVTQLKNDLYPLTGLHQLIAAHCKEQGIECVDLLPKFLGLEETDLWVHPTDQHPNDEGHRLIAAGIYDYVQANPSKPKRR
jgi:lysophospholipase L1-like esterase